MQQETKGGLQQPASQQGAEALIPAAHKELNPANNYGSFAVDPLLVEPSDETTVPVSSINATSGETLSHSYLCTKRYNQLLS